MLEAYAESQGMFLEAILPPKIYPDLADSSLDDVATKLDSCSKLLIADAAVFANMTVVEFETNLDSYQKHVQAALEVFSKLLYLQKRAQYSTKCMNIVKTYKKQVMYSVINSPIAIQFWTMAIQKKIDPNISPKYIHPASESEAKPIESCDIQDYLQHIPSTSRASFTDLATAALQKQSTNRECKTQIEEICSERMSNYYTLSEAIRESPKLVDFNIESAKEFRVRVTSWYQSLPYADLANSEIQTLYTLAYSKVTDRFREAYGTEVQDTDPSKVSWEQLIAFLPRWLNREKICTPLDHSPKLVTKGDRLKIKTSTGVICTLCGGPHWATKCTVTPNSQIAQLIRERNLCELCLGKFHRTQACPRRWVCRYCRQKHFYKICPTSVKYGSYLRQTQR